MKRYLILAGMLMAALPAFAANNERWCKRLICDGVGNVPGKLFEVWSPADCQHYEYKETLYQLFDRENLDQIVGGKSYKAPDFVKPRFYR